MSARAAFRTGDRVTVHRAYFADAERPEFGNARGVVTHLDPDAFGDRSAAVHVTLDNGRRVWGHGSSFTLDA